MEIRELDLELELEEGLGMSGMPPTTEQRTPDHQYAFDRTVEEMTPETAPTPRAMAGVLPTTEATIPAEPTTTAQMEPTLAAMTTPVEVL